MVMFVETIDEYLKRGGKITKVKAGEMPKILTVGDALKPEPAYYEMDCDPIKVEITSDRETWVLNSEADNDNEDE
jgi:hypothetical protein